MKSLIVLSCLLLLGACAAGGGGVGGGGGGGERGASVPGGSGSPGGAGAGTSGSAGAGAGGAGAGVGPGGAGAGASAGAGAAAGTAGGAGGPGGGTADTGAPARTTAEGQAEIDRRLDASLGEFDDQLRREQQRTAEQRDKRAANRAGIDAGSITDDLDGDGDVDAADNETLERNRAGDLRSESAREAAQRSGSGTGADASGEGVGGATEAGGGGVAARAIPSGQDDDIIARRLRKAAEAETDPELKDKLWKEYIDYKQNTKGG